MVTDDYLLAGGLRLHHRDWTGPSPEAPTVVLLHGFTGHARTWDTLAQALSARYRVLALDARGHGESSWDPDGAYGVDEQVGDVVAVLGALGLSSVSALGLSMGGRTVTNLAAVRADLVDRLVIVDIGPVVAAAGAARIGASVSAPDVFDTPEDAFVAARAANPVPPEDALRHRIRNNLLLRPDGRWTWRWDPALRGSGRSNLPRPDPAAQWELLGSITAPTLVVRGAQSDVLAAEDAARMVRDIADCTLVEVADAGHTVPLDQPERFLDTVRPFLFA